MLCHAKAEFNSLTNSLIYHMRSEHEGEKKTVETDDRQSGITSLASSVSIHWCDATRAEKISQLIMKMATGDVPSLSFVKWGS